MSLFGSILKTAGGFLAGGPAGAAAALATELGGGGGGKTYTGLTKTGGFARTQGISSGPVLPDLQPVGMQEKPKIIGRTPAGDIQVGPVVVNPPFLGSPGMGTSLVPRVTVPQSRNGATTPSGRSYAQGGANLPMVGQIGTEPDVVNVPTRKCPRGNVLAFDGKCYPKRMVPKSLRFWKPGPKPPISAKDWKAATTAGRVRDKLIDKTKAAGGYAAKSKPRPRSKKC